jgi:hypothetical protein
LRSEIKEEAAGRGTFAEQGVGVEKASTTKESQKDEFI